MKYLLFTPLLFACFTVNAQTPSKERLPMYMEYALSGNLGLLAGESPKAGYGLSVNLHTQLSDNFSFFSGLDYNHTSFSRYFQLREQWEDFDFTYDVISINLGFRYKRPGKFQPFIEAGIGPDFYVTDLRQGVSRRLRWVDNENVLTNDTTRRFARMDQAVSLFGGIGFLMRLNNIELMARLDYRHGIESHGLIYIEQRSIYNRYLRLSVGLRHKLPFGL